MCIEQNSISGEHFKSALDRQAHIVYLLSYSS